MTEPAHAPRPRPRQGPTWAVALTVSAAMHVWFVFGFQMPFGGTKPTALALPTPAEPVLIPPETIITNAAASTNSTAENMTLRIPAPLLPDPLPRQLEIPVMAAGQTDFSQLASGTVGLPADYKERLDFTVPNPPPGIEGVFGVVYESQDVDNRPVPIFRVSPRLRSSIQSAISGKSITARFIVTDTGEVKDVTIISCDVPEAIAPAITALQSWRFVPGVKQGRKVNTRVEQELKFAEYNPFRT